MKFATVIALAVLFYPAAMRAGEGADEIARGREFVLRNCSRCHAVEGAGESPHAKAPPFRRLGEKYPIEMLAEALAEGIVVGHQDMPEFELAPPNIREVLSYIESIQSKPPIR